MSTVDAEPGTEIVVRPPGTLFRTDDPGIVVSRATEVARVLSTVLVDRKLTKQIGDKHHVLVEGWTLCGSMLGVFPVVEWTRKLENGWEARVEARTIDGSVIGAAEAQCTREEREWGPNPSRGRPRDDYALRSMAQTRATSKALRGPLGFIVALAGFEATPAEEMPHGNGQPQPEAFDPGRDLLPGAIEGDNYFERIGEALEAIDAAVDWKLTLESVRPEPMTEEFYRRLSNFVAKLGDVESFPPKSDEEIVEALAWAFEGRVLELVRPVEEELDESTVEAAERDEEARGQAAEDYEGEIEPAPLSSDEPIPSDDDIEF